MTTQNYLNTPGDVMQVAGDVIKRVRAQDPATSVAAAERSTRFSETHKGRILAALEEASTATALEIGLAAGLSVEQVDRRLPELARDNLAEVLRIGDADVTRDGFRVWRLKKICATTQQNEGAAT